MAAAWGSSHHIGSVHVAGACRHGGGGRQHNPAVYRQQRPADRHVDTARPAVRSDTADGAARPARRNLETARFCRLGSSPGLSYTYH